MPRNADGPKHGTRNALPRQMPGKGGAASTEGYKLVAAEETHRRNQNIKRLKALRLADEEEKAKLGKPNSN